MSIFVNAEKLHIWFFHYGEKLTFYTLEVWPQNFLLTKLGPPVLKFGDNLSLTLAAGPDFSVRGKSVYESFTADVIPVVCKGPFLGIFVNEAGINKDKKGLYLFRHSITYRDIGVRYCGLGCFGEENECLQAGPMARYRINEKFCMEGWFSVNAHDKEKRFEFVFNVKL